MYNSSSAAAASSSAPAANNRLQSKDAPGEWGNWDWVVVGLHSGDIDEVYVLDLTTDILDAVDSHVQAGYSGEEFLFSKDGAFPRYIHSDKRPLKLVQRKLGLRLLSHHKLGRHSVASQGPSF